MLRAAESDTGDEAGEGLSKENGVECQTCLKCNVEPSGIRGGVVGGVFFLEVAQLWNLFALLCLLGSCWLS